MATWLPGTNSLPTAAAKQHSIGIKFVVVCGLALLMSLLALFVSSLVDDRSTRKAEVIREIGAQVGGPQTFLGPTLLIPYTQPPETPSGVQRSGTYVVFARSGTASLRATTEERRRSLFRVPVFHADAKLDATFDLQNVGSNGPAGMVLDWKRAELVVGVSDPRGAMTDGTLTTGAAVFSLAPSHLLPSLTLNNAVAEGDASRLAAQAPAQITVALFGVSAAGAERVEALHASASLRFSGAQRMAVLAYADTTHVTMESAWPSPGFDGGFLPLGRTVSASGFRGDWTVPYLARGIMSEGDLASVAQLGATAMGVSFIEVADPYQSVSRSVKYAPLFLGLVFLSYFLFEVTARRRVHPAQYLLVGVAQLIFYLLLLSLAEHIGFDWGFVLGGTATVLLLSANAGWIFRSRPQALRAAAIFAPLYGMIYLLLRLEDNALLVGALGSFCAVAAAMYFTRSVDWYGAGSASGSEPSTVMNAPTA